MAESSDHQLGSKRACYICKEDKINNLPDEIVIHILSLLPTMFSVRTSVLSKRWKPLWASVPTLDFDDYVYHPFSNLIVANFIDKALLGHNLPSIHRFHLRAKGMDIAHLNAWIEAIVRRGIQKIDLFVSTNVGQPVSRDIFTCETLVELDIRGVYLDVPASVYFPCLKIFRIFMNSPSNDLTNRLFCSCPVLEKLHISGIIDYEKRVFNISSPALRTLELDILSNALEILEIAIDAPILENLSIYMHRMTHYFLKTPSSVVKAEIIGINVSLRDNVLGLLKEIVNIEHLHLNSTAFTALKGLHPDYFPVFSNLRKLKLDVLRNSD